MKNENISKVTGRTEITIYANVEGRMWWPQDKVEFPINRTFYRKTESPFEQEFYTLRHALLQLQSSGDYQNLDFTEPVEIVLERKTDWIDNTVHRSIKSITRRKVLYVTPEHPDYSDLFVH